MVTVEDIEQCLHILATLCEAYGEAYWPTFEVFERELEKRRTLSARIKSYTKNRKPIEDTKYNISL